MGGGGQTVFKSKSRHHASLMVTGFATDYRTPKASTGALNKASFVGHLGLIDSEYSGQLEMCVQPKREAHNG